MEKEFVTYEIALALKELGFGIIGEYIQLPYYYDLKGNLIINHIGVRRKNKPYQIGADTIDDFEAYLSITDNSSEDFVLTPLWQQAIDWFRESKNIIMEVWYDNTQNDGFPWLYEIYINNKEHEHNGSYYDSFYEAREQAILKVIELCQKEK